MAENLPPGTPEPAPAPPTAPRPSTQPAPAPPPAAAVVVSGQKTEREIALEGELNAERSNHATTAKEKKEREVKIAELEDQLRTLRAEPAKKKGRGILDLSEFFEE